MVSRNLGTDARIHVTLLLPFCHYCFICTTVWSIWSAVVIALALAW
jgi:hypothetical protein